MENVDQESIGDLTAYLAGSLIVLSFLVQIAKMIKIGSFRELSYFFLGLQMMVCLLWDTYGIINGLVPVIVMNTVILGSLILALILKLVYKCRRKNAEDNLEKDPNSEKN